ncbi:hypothetical protein VCR15J2_390032 [Vibrio coralliirubri]|nr:hypothetical protein VCR15J2_390032 [Vibrio coralliirubri]
MTEIRTEKLPHDSSPSCPNCRKTLDGFTSLQGSSPSVGDVTICLYCNSTLEFVNILGKLDLKPVSADALMGVDFVELQQNRNLASAVFNEKQYMDKK